MTDMKQRVVFAGASIVGRGTPWGTLCEVTAKAIEPHGYSVEIETRSWGPNNGRFVADGRAILEAWNMMWLRDCYTGSRDFADERPRSNLRVIANINAPAWSAIAVNVASGISDLGQVAGEQRRARVFVGAGPVYQEIIDYYGWTAQALEIVGWFATFSARPTSVRPRGAAAGRATVPPLGQDRRVRRDHRLRVRRLLAGEPSLDGSKHPVGLAVSSCSRSGGGKGHGRGPGDTRLGSTPAPAGRVDRCAGHRSATRRDLLRIAGA